MTTMSLAFVGFHFVKERTFLHWWSRPCKWDSFYGDINPC